MILGANFEKISFAGHQRVSEQVFYPHYFWQVVLKVEIFTNKSQQTQTLAAKSRKTTFLNAKQFNAKFDYFLISVGGVGLEFGMVQIYFSVPKIFEFFFFEFSNSKTRVTFAEWFAGFHEKSFPFQVLLAKLKKQENTVTIKLRGITRPANAIHQKLTDSA